MLIAQQDFNGTGELLTTGAAGEAWNELQAALEDMPLHLKASRQAGIEGTADFDPVGSNSFIKRSLDRARWASGVAMPDGLDALGLDVDYVKNGLVVEVQFSNYPFLLNNLLRTELLYQNEATMVDSPIGVGIIVTKARMFPAANSSLHYEQAVDQLSTLAREDVFDVPLRLVGLREEVGSTVPAVWTAYAGRTSRTVEERLNGTCEIIPPETARGRCTLQFSEA